MTPIRRQRISACSWQCLLPYDEYCGGPPGDTLLHYYLSSSSVVLLVLFLLHVPLSYLPIQSIYLSLPIPVFTCPPWRSSLWSAYLSLNIYFLFLLLVALSAASYISLPLSTAASTYVLPVLHFDLPLWSFSSYFYLYLYLSTYF